MNEDVIVFVSGRLDIKKPENQKIYEMITDLCESLGFPNVWLPHRDTRAYIRKMYSTPKERVRNLYRIDIGKFQSSKLSITFLTDPSTGVGEELRSGDEAGTDVIAVAKEDADVSATVIGNPVIKKFIRYKDLDDLKRRLREILEKYSKDRNYLKANYNFNEIYEEWATSEQRKLYPWIFEC